MATAFIHQLGAMGIFPSRAFIPAFATALLLRFGPEIPVIRDSGLLLGVGTAPTWFTHDITLIVLGILSLLELIATKNSDMRQFMNDFEPHIKTAMAFITTLGVLSATDKQLIAAIQGPAALQLSDFGLAAAIGSGVYFLASIRRNAFNLVLEADPDDDAGIQKVVSWMEDLWVAAGFLLLIFYPLLVLVLAALFGAGLYGLQRYMQYREEQNKIECGTCHKPMHPAALHCPGCKADHAQPRLLGFMGRTTNQLAADRNLHALELLARKRCPCCATRLPLRAAQQSCPACGFQVLADAAQARAYTGLLENRVPTTLGVCALLGLVPVLGMIAGLVYFRFNLIAPFRQYIPWSTGFFLKWSVRLLNVLLILLQVIPIVGAVVLPLMAYTNFAAYRAVFNAGQSNPVRPLAAPVAAVPAR